VKVHVPPIKKLETQRNRVSRGSGDLGFELEDFSSRFAIILTDTKRRSDSLTSSVASFPPCFRGFEEGQIGLTLKNIQQNFNYMG